MDNVHPFFAHKIEAWRTLKPGSRVRGLDHPLDRQTVGATGEFLGYSSRGYARVLFDPQPSWPEKDKTVFLVHPESLEVINAS